MQKRLWKSEWPWISRSRFNDNSSKPPWAAVNIVKIGWARWVSKSWPIRLRLKPLLDCIIIAICFKNVHFFHAQIESDLFLIYAEVRRYGRITWNGWGTYIPRTWLERGNTFETKMNKIPDLFPNQACIHLISIQWGAAGTQGCHQFSIPAHHSYLISGKIFGLTKTSDLKFWRLWRSPDQTSISFLLYTQ